MEEVEDYNKIPVYYCKHCLSLKIKSVDEPEIDFVDYCEECGSTDIGIENIYTWEDMYEKRYGKKYLID